MVSVKPLRTGALMTVFLLSGCVGLGTVSDKSEPGAVVKEKAEAQVATQETRKHGSPSDAPLPQQPYDDKGNKVAYEPSPSPYDLASAKPVPPEAVAQFHKANALMANEQHRDARKAFEAITRDFPELSGPWLKLGELAEIGERMERAERSYRKALEINPNNVNAYLALALFQRRAGDFEAARDTYVSALQLWKDFPEAHRNLAILYDLYMNQPAMAQPHYEAYDFLTGGDDPQVADWLIEIRRRTGIETSFIDIPPPVTEAAAATTDSTESGASENGASAEQIEEKG